MNTFGMGIAVALCIVAYLNWEFRENWDSGQSNAERIYRIQFWFDFQGKQERYGQAPMPLANYLKQNFEDVNAVSRYTPANSNIRIDDHVFKTYVSYADSSFFEMFTVDLNYGIISDFKDKSKIFISDELARKYFDREDVVGEAITQINGGIPKEFSVGGVFKKLPLNSSFDFEAITLWDNYWDTSRDPDLTEGNWKGWNTTFLLINDPSRIGPITKQLQQYIEPQNTARPEFKVKNYYLENFKGISNKSIEEPWLKGNYLRNGQMDVVVVIPSIMSALLLLLACFNFTNTSIALSSQRLKEIGIRKVVGGLRSQLVIQFLTENLFLCSLGLFAGLLIAEFLVPAYNSLWPWIELRVSYRENGSFLLFLFGLLILTGFIAGGYPAFYITSFGPAKILKGKTKLGGTNWFTRILLGSQFCISLLTVIFAAGFYSNAQYQKSFDLGFSSMGVISVFVDNEGTFNTYRDALTQNRDILGIAGTKDHITNSLYTATVKYESIEKEIDVMDVGDNYPETVKMKVISGRGFVKDSQTDRDESVLVTEEFARQFGWGDDPIGKRIVLMDTAQLFVVGVVRNVYPYALWRPVGPMMIRCAAPSGYKQIVVSMSAEKMNSVNGFMDEKWKELFPNSVYDGQFIDDAMKDTNDINRNTILIFGFLGFFASLMSATGLFALVSLNILKKMKEIGIRKILGASLGNIVRVISLEFAIILLIASCLGGLFGYVMVDGVMDTAWEYYKKVNALTLVTSIGIIFFLFVSTVGFKTYNTARMNPVKTMRYE